MKDGGRLRAVCSLALGRGCEMRRSSAKGSGGDISANEEEQRSRWEGGRGGGGGGGGALMHAHLSLVLSSGPNNIHHRHAATASDGTGH